jgi:hypothetical protein
MTGTVGHELQRHPETRKESPGTKQKSQEKQTKTKKDKIIARRHEATGKAKGDGVTNKRTDREKEKGNGNGCNEEKERGGGGKDEREFDVARV